MQTIYLDISNKGVIPCVHAKQSEVGRKFLAVITDNGVPYNIPDNALLSVWYEGDTDAGNYSSIEDKSAFAVDGNKVTVELVAQMLLKHGNGALCLSVTHGDGGETNTWNIPYEVEYKPGAGSAVPTEYYTALTEAGAVAAQNATEAKAAAEEAKRAATMLSIMMPVGYIFHWSRTDNSDIDLSTAEKVANHFGFGTWEQIENRFLFGCGGEYNDGDVGGEEKHLLTDAEMPSHSHTLLPNIRNSDGTETVTSGYNTILTQDNLVAPNTTVAISNVVAGSSGKTGGNNPMNNMPPYLSVYVWKRIA